MLFCARFGILLMPPSPRFTNFNLPDISLSNRILQQVSIGTGVDIYKDLIE